MKRALMVLVKRIKVKVWVKTLKGREKKSATRREKK